MAEGFEYEFVEVLPEELTCSICLKVLCLPHLINCCEQQFCEECLEAWLVDNNSCPHCRSEDFMHMLLRQKSRKIGELKVYCPNKQHGCKAVLKMSDYGSHLSAANEEGCVYVKVGCPNDCAAVVFRGEIDAHVQDECPKRIVCCDYCYSEGEHQYIRGEHEEECFDFPVPCPLGCEAEVLRKDLESHPDTCPLELVECTFSGLGCDVEVPRGDLDKHVQSCMPQHMKAVVKSLVTLQAKHEALQESHEELRESYETLKDSHETLQESHKGLQVSYKTLKDSYKTLQESHEFKLKCLATTLTSSYEKETQIVFLKHFDLLF